MKDTALTLGLIVVCATGLHAQTAPDSRPVVTTSATAQVKRVPDYATVAIGVTTLDSTATAAANSMNAALTSVFDTLVALGIQSDSLPTRRFTIQPEYNYDGQRRLVGYGAHASVTVTVSDLTRLGVIIEGALTAGATDVVSIAFAIHDDREARDEALRMATEEARRDAAALAAAAGTQLGTLKEITTGSRTGGGSELYEMQVQRSAAPIVPAEVVVRATVTASWYLQQ